MTQLAPKYRDDLDGKIVEETEVKRGVTITITVGDKPRKGKKTLDLRDEMYDALVALSDGDPELVRAVFTPPVVEKTPGRQVRTPEEMARIRAAARAAKNADGSPMFPGDMIKERGRQPEVVYTWYTNEYLPSQEATVPTVE